MGQRYRAVERKLGWDPEVPTAFKVLGFLMIAEGVFLFCFGLAVVLTH